MTLKIFYKECPVCGHRVWCRDVPMNHEEYTGFCYCVGPSYFYGGVNDNAKKTRLKRRVLEYSDKNLHEATKMIDIGTREV